MSGRGRNYRSLMQLQRAAEQRCACGHPMREHRELQSTYELRAGELVEVPHPGYVPGHFHCAHEGCGCELRLQLS